MGPSRAGRRWELGVCLMSFHLEIDSDVAACRVAVGADFLMGFLHLGGEVGPRRLRSTTRIFTARPKLLFGAPAYSTRHR